MSSLVSLLSRELLHSCYSCISLVATIFYSWPPSKRQGGDFSASPLPVASYAQTATMCLAPYIQACTMQSNKQNGCYDVSFLLQTVVSASKVTVILRGCSSHVLSLRGSHVCTTRTSEVTGQPGGVVRVVPNRIRSLQSIFSSQVLQSYIFLYIYTFFKAGHFTSSTYAEAERQRSSDETPHEPLLSS